jgi:hypothetical protein
MMTTDAHCGRPFEAVLAPGLEGMQLSPKFLEEICVAKAPAPLVDDQPMAHTELIGPSEDWPAIRVLLAWDVDLHHALPHDPYRYLGTSRNSQAPAVTTTRREHLLLLRRADALRGAMMRECEPYNATMVDNSGRFSPAPV